MEHIRLSLPTWLKQALLNPVATDLCLNGTETAFLDQGNGLEPLVLCPEDQIREDLLRNWILSELSEVGKTWDAKYPFIDATLQSGHRLHVVFPPLARQGMLVSLRRLPQANVNLNQGSTSTRMPDGIQRWNHSSFYSVLMESVRRGDSILISGSTGSGKTTLASDLLGEVSPCERIIALEDTPELAPQHPHFLSLVSRPANADGFGEVSLRTLLKQTLRMRPDRIILGECRGAEVLELLQALNTGHKGSLATLHANSPRDALRRIELLCLLATGGAIPSSGIRELLSHGIQWVAQVKREGPLRKITELWKIEGREGETILMRPMLE